MTPLVQRGDASAWALGALDEREREAFERLLRRDAGAADEAAAYTQVAALLAYAAPEVALPEALRAKVLSTT